MNRTEVSALVAEKTGLKRAEVDKVLDGVFEVVTDALKKGDDVRFVGFGTFGVRDTEAKQGHNPRTGQKIDIPAKRKAVFKAGKELRDAVMA